MSRVHLLKSTTYHTSVRPGTLKTANLFSLRKTIITTLREQTGGRQQ